MNERDITITINTGNAAFQDDPRFEVGRILRELARKVEDNGVDETPCVDANGNKVGWLRIEDDDPIPLEIEQNLTVYNVSGGITVVDDDGNKYQLTR